MERGFEIPVPSWFMHEPSAQCVALCIALALLRTRFMTALLLGRGAMASWLDRTGAWTWASL